MRRRAYLFMWITAVVAPMTELEVLLTEHNIVEAMTAASVASVIATEVAIRLFGRDDNAIPPSTGGTPFALA